MDRIGIIAKLLDMKDTIVTKDGVFQIDSYTGEERKKLKDELYEMVQPPKPKSLTKEEDNDE